MDRLTASYFVLCVIGIAVAAYHAYQELTLNFSSCQISSSINCGGVFGSGHTSIFGVQFYQLGLIWFPLVLVLGLWLTRGGRGPLRGDILVPVLMIGNVFTVYLWYLELGVIHIVCPICVGLYLTNYLMTFVSAKAALKEQ